MRGHDRFWTYDGFNVCKVVGLEHSKELRKRPILLRFVLISFQMIQLLSP